MNQQWLQFPRLGYFLSIRFLHPCLGKIIVLFLNKFCCQMIDKRKVIVYLDCKTVGIFLKIGVAWWEVLV